MTPMRVNRHLFSECAAAWEKAIRVTRFIAKQLPPGLIIR